MNSAIATRPRAICPRLRPVPLPDAATSSPPCRPAALLDAENRFRYVNPAAELFFQLSSARWPGDAAG